jgi:hypothetical protein
MIWKAWVLSWVLVAGSAMTFAQSGSESPVQPEGNSGAGAPNSTAVSASTLERDFFAILRAGSSDQFLSYVPEDGVNVGGDAKSTTRAEIQDQFSHRSGLYCKLFDSTCMQANEKVDAGAHPCSYRELLTRSEKVRTASTETTRNGVRQAILVAEVQNQRCPGPVLIDFIFNYQQGSWKLFSIP